MSAFHQRPQLEPHDIRIDSEVGGAAGEPAIGARYQVLAPHYACPSLDSLGDQLGMLDEVGDRVDDTRYQHLVRRELAPLEHPPFMLVAWIARFEHNSRRARLEHDVDDVLEFNIVIVRALVVAPAQMHA